MSNEEELYDAEIFTLTDEDGNETDFALLATAEIEGVTYMALEPAGRICHSQNCARRRDR